MIRTEDVNKELQSLSDQLASIKDDNAEIILAKISAQVNILTVKILRDMKINQTMIMRKLKVPLSKPNNQHPRKNSYEKK